MILVNPILDCTCLLQVYVYSFYLSFYRPLKVALDKRPIFGLLYEQMSLYIMAMKYLRPMYAQSG